MPHRLRDSDSEVVDYFRCTILRWDETYIYATREDNDQEVRINYAAPNAYVPGDWTYLRNCMVQGEALNVVRPRVSNGDILPELLIYAPDYLINVTTVAKCFTPFGCTAFAELVNRISPAAQSRHILLGNFAGQLLDEVAYGENFSYAESIKAFFKRNALDIATCPDLDNNFHAEAKQQRIHIDHIMKTSIASKLPRLFAATMSYSNPHSFQTPSDCKVVWTFSTSPSAPLSSKKQASVVGNQAPLSTNTQASKSPIMCKCSSIGHCCTTIMKSRFRPHASLLALFALCRGA